MKLYKSWWLPATCTIILVVTTYATSTEAAKQKQAEVNLQQVAAIAAPSRALKYGDKTTKKLPNQEIHLLPTSPTLVDKNISSKRTRSRVEHIELPTNRANAQISRRYESGTQQNQLIVEHDIPIVHKSQELFNKPITPTTAGQQRNAISNRSRSANTLTKTQQQLQPTQYSALNDQIDKSINNIKTTTTVTHNSRQHKPTTTSRTIPHKNNNHPPLSSRNANVQTHHSTSSSSNSTFVSHHRGNTNKNNNNFNSKSQPLLASSNAVAITSGDGLHLNIETSSKRQKGNVPENQNISNGNITSNRLNIRKFTPTSTTSPSTITIISPASTTSTTTTTTRPPFQLPNNFNIFTSEFWQFLNPNTSPAPRIGTTTKSTSTTTTRKPPKKYKPPTQITTKEEKLSLVKPKQTVTARTTTSTIKPDLNNQHNDHAAKRDDGPFRIALPTFNILTSRRETYNEEGEKDKRNADKEGNLRERFDCPRESEVRFQLFPKICKIDEDCKVWNREEICCEIFGAKSCVSGIPKPLEETSHAPILGVIPRKCPNRPLAELWWEVKECETDMDCWPRVCCPDGRRRYCRTSQPELNTVPVPVQRSFNYLSEYLECTPPPPPIFDLHPKACTSTLDCFPNVCCQEAGLRHCRPPKKSVLTMLANVFNVDFVKRLTQNIVIK
ncbi:mucin-5AC isoform X1 [Lucilia cuprina]|uniref:mucin-5AC isoform X1 n=1 Tax=Lucilia cuprina TaxID=7375 RepID=UPI001F06A4DB|nr:mucin-5AC isoform X1 [Lucilia cuprina]